MVVGSSLRVVFMGTARFAVPSLEALAHGGYHVVAVVSQPARPAGRGRKVMASPVAQAADRLRLPLLTPERIRDEAVVEQIAQLSPDLIVVAAYAQILPRSVLAIPLRGCVNVHGSLLPRWRGASPIQAAILAGDEFTGVTLMLMAAGMDTGPMLGQIVTRIEDADGAPDLEARLASGGASLLASVLPCYLFGTAVPVPQEEGSATYAPLIKKEDGLIDWSLPALRIWRAVRAYRPWPGAYTYWNGRMLKVLSCRVRLEVDAEGQPGTVIRVQGGDLGVTTGDGLLMLGEVAIEGGRPVRANDFALGHRDFVGSKVGPILRKRIR